MKEINSKNMVFKFLGATGTIFIVPLLLLRIPVIHTALSWFLQPLWNGEYKTSYIEFFGAIFGTFLAVVGTLWIQKKIDEVTEKRELKESAIVVYYDFKFAFNDIIKFMQSYLFSKRPITNMIDDFETYKKCKKKYRMYIDDNWIHNVAKLSHSLSSNEIQKIYKLYGDLNTIKKVYNIPMNEVSEDEDNFAYSIMFHDICSIEIDLKYPYQIEVSLKDDIKTIMKRLKEIGNISDTDI